MSIRLGNVTILVRDYDEALKFYTWVSKSALMKSSDRGHGGSLWAVLVRMFRLFCKNPSPRCEAKRMPAG
jgi:catechol 2,3-dioxygenase-like lactoylglutathione lyase family enzyme